MEPLPLAAATVGVIVGALLAWVIRGRQLRRQRGVLETHRLEYEEKAAKEEMRIQMLERDRETVLGDLEQARNAKDEVEAGWLRDQEVARELLTKAEARIDRLSAELGQLREQLGRAHRDADLQKQVSVDLEEQLDAARQRLQGVEEQVHQQQQQLAAARRQRDEFSERLEAGTAVSADRPQRRRWRINTFFEG
ncbi:MAG TPA: hypothetical protein DCE43_00295 [Planctomycetaceae bacterium]|jgi:chromosome segregation ATPase|nr:hypothetical protein [Planctomycetaceae bacterium]HCK54499.1 hypothetical protein [Planctomycetaceae bacterium]|tara:strand:- start:374 stop:955 length:582 start_codon:yes stop_codon:yes gene_type:complete